jgi:hypothetical protein
VEYTSKLIHIYAGHHRTEEEVTELLSKIMTEVDADGRLEKL